MTIRPATVDDLPQVLPMVARLARLHESWDPQRYPYLADVEQRYDGWLRVRAADSRSVFLVAEVARTPSPRRGEGRGEGRNSQDQKLPVCGDSPLTPTLWPDGERENRIIALAIATVESNIPIYRLSEYAVLHDLWVEEEYRHEGIGRQMTMLVIERLKEMGVKQIRLETAALNDTARELFLQCGFRISTIEMILELD